MFELNYFCQMLTESEILFIKENLTKDPFQLSLAAKKNTELDISKLAYQIQARQKLSDKLPSWVRTQQSFSLLVFHWNNLHLN